MTRSPVASAECEREGGVSGRRGEGGPQQWRAEAGRGEARPRARAHPNSRYLRAERHALPARGTARPASTASTAGRGGRWSCGHGLGRAAPGGTARGVGGRGPCGAGWAGPGRAPGCWRCWRCPRRRQWCSVRRATHTALAWQAAAARVRSQAARRPQAPQASPGVTPRVQCEAARRQ